MRLYWVRTQNCQQDGEYRQGAHHDAGDRPARQSATAPAAAGREVAAQQQKCFRKEHSGLTTTAGWHGQPRATQQLTADAIETHGPRDNRTPCSLHGRQTYSPERALPDAWLKNHPRRRTVRTWRLAGAPR